VDVYYFTENIPLKVKYVISASPKRIGKIMDVDTTLVLHLQLVGQTKSHGSQTHTISWASMPWWSLHINSW